MAQEYPFDIPESIQKDVLAGIVQAAPPWADLEEWDYGADNMVLFGYFYCWHSRTEDLVENLKFMRPHMEPLLVDEATREKWGAFEGALFALYARFQQFSGLLEWARDTWKYDPAVLELIDGNGSKDTSPDETSEGAGGGLQ